MQFEWVCVVVTAPPRFDFPSFLCMRAALRVHVQRARTRTRQKEQGNPRRRRRRRPMFRRQSSVVTVTSFHAFCTKSIHWLSLENFFFLSRNCNIFSVSSITNIINSLLHNNNFYPAIHRTDESKTKATNSVRSLVMVRKRLDIFPLFW